jgi:protein SCO1
MDCTVKRHSVGLWLRARMRHCRVLPYLLLTSLLLPHHALAADTYPPQQPALSDTTGSDAPGLDERLGAKLPMDAVFRDENGRPVRLGDLITGPTIVLPVYYSCLNVCNMMQQNLARALPQVKQAPGTEYRVISISFDDTETPALASRFKKMYLTSMHAPFPEAGWHFLTGDAVNIRRVTDAAGYGFRKQGREFIHPVASLVVDRNGTIVRYLQGTTFLPKDISLALLEAGEGKTGMSIRTVVGYCFSFDPERKTYVFNLLRVSATVIILCLGSFIAFLLLTGRNKRNLSGRP